MYEPVTLPVALTAPDVFTAVSMPTEVILGCAFVVTVPAKVAAFELQYFLSKVNWKNYKYIEFMKIDTQGNDLNVLKSTGIYLKRIMFIQMEYFANQSYVGGKSRKESLRLNKKFMKQKQDFTTSQLAI